MDQHLRRSVSRAVVTVVIPTRDRPQLARRAIASALAQTYPVIEVIVVDDGSDQVFTSDFDDPRLRTLRRERAGGVTAARNWGLDEARGSWITFLDDDDELFPQMLEKALAAAAGSKLPGPIAVLSATEVIDPHGEQLEIRRPPTLPRGSHYFLESTEGASFQTQASLVAPTELVRAIGGWDEALLASEHDDFFLRLNEACSIEGVGAVTYRIHEHLSSRLHVSTLSRAAAMARTVAKHAPIFEQHPDQHAHYLATIGATYLRAGCWGPAIRWTTKSLLADPRKRQHYLWWLAALLGPRFLQLYRRIRGKKAEFPEDSKPPARA